MVLNFVTPMNLEANKDGIRIYCIISNLTEDILVEWGREPPFDELPLKAPKYKADKVGPGKRMAKKTNGHFLWRMATWSIWQFTEPKIPFPLNGHGHSPLPNFSFQRMAMAIHREQYLMKIT